MYKRLYKILFITIGISFFISATEMDLGDVQNTFFDEYDTYVKAEHISVDHANTTQQEHDTYALIHYLFNNYKGSKVQPQSLNHKQFEHCNQYPPKLFLLNSVWRIWYCGFYLTAN